MLFKQRLFKNQYKAGEWYAFKNKVYKHFVFRFNSGAFASFSKDSVVFATAVETAIPLAGIKRIQLKNKFYLIQDYELWHENTDELILKSYGLGFNNAVIAMSVFAAPKFNSKKSISVLSREDGSGTRGAFIELFGIEKKDASGKKIDYTTDEASITNSTAVMLTSVAGDRYAIGYVSLGSLNNSVKAVKIDGAEATVTNINNGSYKISRPFNIAVKDGLSSAAQDFVNFIVSDEGQKVIAANKYIKIQLQRFH